MSLTILKIGGSLITKKTANKPTLNKKNLTRICREVASAHPKSKLILIHGAGSFGHPIVAASGIDKGIKNQKQKIAFAETQKLQNELNVLVCKDLQKFGMPAFPLQASASAIMEKGKLKYLDINVIKRCLDIELVPVLFGTPAFDTVQGCSILSGDEIAAYLTKKLKTKRVIFATDVDGVLDSSNRIITNLDKEASKNLNGIPNSKIDVTGGMIGKVEIFLRNGLKCEVINGNKKGFIKRSLLGEVGLGTTVN